MSNHAFIHPFRSLPGPAPGAWLYCRVSEHLRLRQLLENLPEGIDLGATAQPDMSHLCAQSTGSAPFLSVL